MKLGWGWGGCGRVCATCLTSQRESGRYGTSGAGQYRPKYTSTHVLLLNNQQRRRCFNASAEACGSGPLGYCPHQLFSADTGSWQTYTEMQILVQQCNSQIR